MEETKAVDDMQTPAVRRKVKRLLKLLKSQQHHDTILTPATVMSFKYLLPYNSLVTRCKIRFNVSDQTGRKEEAYVRYERSRGSHGEFIVSQLEAQMITDPNNKKTVTIPHALDIFLKCVVYDFDGEYAWPTIITWADPIRHRNLYFFVYLNFPMPSAVYTIPELLALRKKGERARKRLMDSYEPENEMAAILEQQGIRDWRSYLKEMNPNWTPPPPPPNPKDLATPVPARDDTSSSSEEVLFKGTARRRRQATSQDTVASRQGASKGQMGWKYAPRLDSDSSATEPLSAPTGLPAQKSEGFQRFYKAVVSPTHVRVTAGGRIVPNTRAPPSSPSLKRAQEGSIAGSNNGNDKASGNANQVPMQPTGPGMGQQMPSMMPPFYPGFGHPGIQPYGPQMPQMPQMQLVPLGYGPPMTGGYQTFPYPMPMLRQPSVESALKDTLNLKTGDGQVDTNDDQQKGTKAENSNQIQNDPSRRPVFFNGQWLYPVQPPFPTPNGLMNAPFMPMPMPMHPMQMQQMQQHMQQMQQMQMQMAMARGAAPAPGPPVPPSSQPSQLGSPIKLPSAAAGQQGRVFTGGPMMPQAVPVGFGFPAPAAPPISSIRPSEITRKQIGIFRKSLKYHEDQLQYNRHQIDEKDTEQKIQKYRDDIARFEAMMRAQIEEEKNRGYPPLSEKDKSSEDSSASGKKTSTTSEEAMPNGVAVKQPAAVAGSSSGLSNSLNPADQLTRPLSQSSSSQQMDDVSKKSALPTGAALAPPFEPRKDTPSAPSVTDSAATTWTTTGYPKHGGDGSYGGFMAGAQPWGPSIARPDAPMYANPARQAFNTNVTSVTSKGYLDVPYLIGSLPQGMNPRTAKDIDYQYSRELTEDEVRARHLYWGKVPRFAVRGLPKYDGRNFYPPSPVKDALRVMSASQSGNELLSFTPESANNDLLAFTPGPIGSKLDAQPARPSTPVGSALVPCDSFEYAQEQNCDDGIYKVIETVKVAGKPGSIKGKSETEAVVDSASFVSHDRRSEKPGGARLWEAMLKKGSSTALSSTSAEAKLQSQYAGSAAASLSPTVNRTSDGPASPGKESVDNEEGGALLTPMPERRGKNRALSGEPSREQLVSNGNGGVSAALGA